MTGEFPHKGPVIWQTFPCSSVVTQNYALNILATNTFHVLAARELRPSPLKAGAKLVSF